MNVSSTRWTRVSRWISLGTVVAVLSVAAPAQASVQLLEPPEGATLSLSQGTNFSWDQTCTGYAGIQFSTSSAVKPDGTFVNPALFYGGITYAYGFPTSGSGVHTYSLSPSSLSPLPTSGSTLYWVAGCGRDSGGGLVGDDVSGVRSLVVGPAPPQPPPPGPPRVVGVSINAGAKYTNDPNVTLDTVAPDYALIMLASNDGGFGDYEIFDVPESYRASYPWRLQSSGPERLPKTVYLRFGYFSGEPNPRVEDINRTDDIILDETIPKVESVALLGSEGSQAKATKGQPAYKLKIKAKDKTSGVKKMQITSKKSKPGKWKGFKKQPKFSTSGHKIFVRVRDGAGNPSKWKRAQ